MRLKGIIDCDFVNYKKISMYLAFPFCDFKCDKECGRDVCQNSPLTKEPIYDVPVNEIYKQYAKNPMVHALICAGLEPFDSYEELKELIAYFREKTFDDIVIYTGYTEEELEDKLVDIVKYGNIIIKFGRFIPDDQEYFNELLGVKLASKNQYVIRYK